MKSSYEIKDFETFNTMVDSFKEYCDGLNWDYVQDDIDILNNTKSTAREVTTPFYNFRYMKRILKEIYEKGHNKFLMARTVKDLYSILWRCYGFVIILTMIGVIVNPCVFTLLADDMLFIKISVLIVTISLSIISIITSVRLLIKTFADVDDNDNEYNFGWAYMEKIQFDVYWRFLVYFNYIFKKTNIGISIKERNKLILRLNNGEEYEFKNVEGVMRKIRTINPSDLYLENDFEITTNKGIFHITLWSKNMGEDFMYQYRKMFDVIMREPTLYVKFTDIETSNKKN